jgi:hypothetical protein
MKLKVEPTNDVCIKFTEDQMKELNIKPGEKFTITAENNRITLTRFVTLNLNLSEFSRETLEDLITLSCERDVSVNELVEEALRFTIGNVPKFVKHENNNEPPASPEEIEKIRSQLAATACDPNITFVSAGHILTPCPKEVYIIGYNSGEEDDEVLSVWEDNLVVYHDIEEAKRKFEEEINHRKKIYDEKYVISEDGMTATDGAFNRAGILTLKL